MSVKLVDKYIAPRFFDKFNKKKNSWIYKLFAL